MQECIRFLEHSVHHLESGDEALHNLLVALYVSHKPDNIIPYLTSGILNIYNYASRIWVVALNWNLILFNQENI